MWDLSLLDPLFHTSRRLLLHPDVPSVLHLQRVAGHPPDPSHPLDLLPHQGDPQGVGEGWCRRPEVRQRAKRQRRERQQQEGRVDKIIRTSRYNKKDEYSDKEGR